MYSGDQNTVERLSSSFVCYKYCQLLCNLTKCLKNSESLSNSEKKESTKMTVNPLCLR